MNRVGLLFLGAMVVIAAAPSSAPRALAGVAGGLWEVSRSADGHGGARRCLPDVILLAQWEHASGRCTRTLLVDEPSHARLRYSCADGGYGQSDIRVLTPRSLRIETQGISMDYPFAYTLHARRIGDCGPR